MGKPEEFTGKPSISSSEKEGNVPLQEQEMLPPHPLPCTVDWEKGTGGTERRDSGCSAPPYMWQVSWGQRGGQFLPRL